MTEYDDTADWLQSRDTIERDLDGHPIEIRDITEAELEKLEERAAGDPEAEAEVIKEAIDEYLVEPDVPAADIPMNKRQRVWFAMQLAWSGAEDIQAAMEELQIPGQGNR